MPDFANPFPGVVPERKLSIEELVRAVRLDLAAEEEAVHLYLSQADASDNALAKKVLTDVANEERQHAGEFLRLLQLLTGDEDKWLAAGAREVDVNAAQLGMQEKEPPQAGDKATIGSLKQ